MDELICRVYSYQRPIRKRTRRKQDAESGMAKESALIIFIRYKRRAEEGRYHAPKCERAKKHNALFHLQRDTATHSR
jgi:hypothetical protein